MKQVDAWQDAFRQHHCLSCRLEKCVKKVGAYSKLLVKSLTKRGCNDAK